MYLFGVLLDHLCITILNSSRRQCLIISNLPCSLILLSHIYRRSPRLVLQSPSSSMTTTTRPPETNSGIITSWLEVTSAWPSVSQCSTEIYSQIGDGEGLAAIAFDPYFGSSISTQITCLPPIATSWWNQVLQTPLQTITSIGPLVCPQLYTTATTSVLNPASTFVACCPS